MPTITLNVPAAIAQRISVAYGHILNTADEVSTPRNATLVEVENYWKEQIRTEVLRDEERVRKEGAVITPVTFT